MFTKQFYTNCLAQGAYYIESNGEAAVIDPMRETEPYIQMAAERNAQIKFVFETHFHADFVSGHVDLAKKTGAQIVYGPTSMQTGFEMTTAKDGQEFRIGDITIRLIHTPGHTMESSCYLLIDENGKEAALFTGDTLFIGDVGRPDLAQKVIAELTQEKLAAHLYDSIHTKILPLSDEIIIYPGHGAGSACGKKLSNETQDTLGNQKQSNYALNPSLTKEAFIKEVLTGLTPPPGYFPQNVLLNIKGYDSFDEVLNRSAKGLSPQAFQIATEQQDVFILDTRGAEEFAKAFIPGSVNIGLNGSFASWVGTIIPKIDQKILLITDEGKQDEAILRMARVGYDSCIGYLQGGIAAWTNAGFTTDTIQSVTAEEYHKQYDIVNNKILDVRKESEYNTEHIIGTQNVPLDYVQNRLEEVNAKKTTYVHCAAGYRSMIFISLLRKKGFTNLINIEGGFTALKNLQKLPMSEYAVQTTEL